MPDDLVRKIRRIRRIGVQGQNPSKIPRQREELSSLITNLKKQPCMDCKQRFHPACMDLDHLPQYRKRFTVSQFIREHGGDPNAKALLESEIQKCQVVCSNCHRLRTWFRAKRKKLNQ